MTASGRSLAPRATVGFDYVLLFESSGMYRGEETVPLLSQLATGRLDAVWGSRRLSVRDIEESYRFRYSASALGGTVSYLGSYALSLACLMLYGRYITDTLSGVRAIRAADVLDPRVDLGHKNANHVLLSRLLRRKAEILEIPVRFVPLAPDRVKRTSALEGLRALATLVTHRFSGRPARAAADHVCPGIPAAERSSQMTSRLLIVPAAGLGTRLGADRPKLLVPVAGIPMIDRLLGLFAGTVDRAVVVVASVVRAPSDASISRAPAVPVTTIVQTTADRDARRHHARRAGRAGRRARRGLDYLVRSGGDSSGHGSTAGRVDRGASARGRRHADGIATEPVHSSPARQHGPHRRDSAPARR